MIQSSPRNWAKRPALGTSEPSVFTLIVRHGLWIFLLVIVTVWEVLGFIFPAVGSITPEWWDHPTISQEIKTLIGTSLVGRLIATLVIAALSVVLALHWAWRIPA